MMEILFRGKRIHNGEWVYGYFVRGNKRKSLRDSIFVYDSETQSFNDYEINPSTLGQYTGLTDKNGKRIFEGDILKWDSIEWGCDHLEIASWDYELFNMRRNDWEEWCEVIGNIHDNKLEDFDNGR